MILSLFSGAGGMDVAAHWLGLESFGVEYEPRLAAIAQAAGHDVRVDDVRNLSLLDPRIAARFDGLQGGPPCQTFSNAGKGDGRALVDLICHLARTASAAELREWARSAPGSYGLVLEPLRFALEAIEAGHPLRFLALEQVPPVLPIWVAVCERLEAEGYSTDVAVLKAEQFGVPQTRRRAVAVARLDGDAKLPTPTHRAYRKGVAQHKGDLSLLEWVSMAQALGWGATERPSWTVCGGGTATGGAEPWGNGARRSAAAEEDRGAWVQRSNYADSPRADARTAAERGRTTRSLDEPSVTVTSKGARWDVVRSGMNSELGGGRTKRHERDADYPAPTVTTPSDRWELRADGDSRRLTIEEAATLQTFPDGHPWHVAKRKGDQFLGCGNAAPPLLWQRVLEAITR